MQARLRGQTIDEDCYEGDDPDDKSDSVTERPSQDGKQEWERRLMVFGPSGTGIAFITPAFRHAALPLI
jgi:hypothetical protein